MPQIGFTHKTEPIYDRFNAMRRAYEDSHGRTYAPDFLAVLMDAFEERQAVSAAMQDVEKELQPVRIKDGDNRYVNNAIVATTNLFLTDDRSEAIVFDSPDKAKEFLCKYGRSAEGWIFEPVNELQ